MQLDREKELNGQLKEQVLKEQKAAKAKKMPLRKFKKLFRVLNTQAEHLATNGFLVGTLEKSLDTEKKLRVYLSLDNLRKMEELIVQTMQEHKAELEASPLHMLMVECTKDIEEFSWVLNDGVAIKSTSFKSIQSIFDDEPTEEPALEDSEEKKGEGGAT